jgi:cytochrome P450
MNRALPFIGHTHYLMGLHPDPLGFFLDAYRQHGRVFALAMGRDRVAVMLGPEAHRFILERETEYLSWGAAYNEGGRRVFGGTALPLIDGEEHRRRRAPMTSTFRHQNVAAYLDSMVAFTRAQSAGWGARREVEFVSEMSEVTFRVACGFLYGSDVGEDYPRFREIYRAMFSHRGLIGAALGLPGTERRRRALNTLAARWLDERRGRSDRQDLLSSLLAAGLDDEDVIAQMLIVMFAGHDTTKSMLSWTMLLLLRHPEYLARVMREQEETFGGGPLTVEGLRRLGVLDRALRESNRLYAPAPVLQRGVLKEFEFGGYTVPRGWKVAYLPLVSHYLPDVFSDPSRFDPDRFAPPRDEHKRPYALVDFGGGHRVCIGKELSLFEGKAVLSHLLREFTFELVPGQKIVARVGPTTTQPKHGLRLRATPRERAPAPHPPTRSHSAAV